MANETTQPQGPAKQAQPTEEDIPLRKRVRAVVKFQPPLMPLIDVMFTLMLFFLVTCHTRQYEGNLPATLPANKEGGATGPILKEMHIVITPSGADGASYSFSDSGLSMPNPQQLYEQLEARKREIPGASEAPIIIDVMQGVRWEHVVSAFNEALRAKFKNIAFSGE